MRTDPHELAWAAGFFDGEGSTVARTFGDRPGYRQLGMTVGQAGAAAPPEVLVRFQHAVRGMGTLGGPDEDGVYRWRAFGRDQVHAALALLWPCLGEVKRAQATGAIVLVEQQYGHGLYGRRAARAVASDVAGVDPNAPTDGLHVAWAAGFLDAEGCFGLNRARGRAGAPDWYRIRCSASQHGGPGRPAAVLIRLQRTLGGRIERHGEEDDHKWVVEGAPAVERVLALVGPWLGQVKRDQATVALARFQAQLRLRGDAVTCARGHAYSRTTLRGGRLRKICDTCEEHRHELRRSRLRTVFQRFEEAALLYTS